ncbi:MAG: hypothetical protein JXN59_15170 [Anaerolineae bacterium]|nr:hypothetical protein [Anaerolineae bacterium]
MAKYIFSQGKVEVEEGIYLPASPKDRRVARTGVLIVIPPPSHTGKQIESTDKENAHDER